MHKLKKKQHDQSDCGPTCLSAIFAHFGHQVSISRIRDLSETNQQGTSLFGLVSAAEKLGFNAKVVKCNLQQLPELPRPALLHLVLESGLHHFVLLVAYKGKKFTIMDPADGKFHRFNPEELGKTWTQVVMVAAPQSDGIKIAPSSSNFSKLLYLINPQSTQLLGSVLAAVLVTVLGFSITFYLQHLIDHIIPEKNIWLLNILSAGMIFVLLFQYLVFYLRNLVALQMAQTVDANLVLGYYQHLLKMPHKYLENMRIGELLSRISDAIKIREFVANTGIQLIIQVLVLVSCFVIMLLANPKLALLSFLFILLYGIVFIVNQQYNRKWQRKTIQASAAFENEVVEELSTVSTIKSFALEKTAFARVEHKFLEFLFLVGKTSKQSFSIATILEILNRVFVVLILWLGGLFVINNVLTIGELLSFYALVAYVTGPASAIIGAVQSVEETLIACDRLFELLDIELKDHKSAIIPFGSLDNHNIDFKDVSFAYSINMDVFEHLSFRIPSGSFAALVGESGCGKSSIAGLLTQQLCITKGSITIGSIGIHNIEHQSLVAAVAVVPQRIEFFSATILQNIVLDDLYPDWDWLMLICSKLGIDAMINKLAHGFNTLLLDNGYSLSGGQRQKLAIARALYKKPKILILDEATSNLDTVSSAVIDGVIQWYHQQGNTVILIAHQLNAIRNCNLILALEKNTIQLFDSDLAYVEHLKSTHLALSV